jgi:hypothetical protein
MSWKKKTTDETISRPPNGPRPIDRRIDAEDDLEIDPILTQALQDFRTHAHAWSATAYSRPHAQVRAERSGWRPALAWALGCLLVAGGLSGAFYERHEREATAARMALQAREAQQRQLAAQQQRAADENLLATVDSDISRDVPAAMEPLAQLMDEDAAQ